MTSARSSRPIDTDAIQAEIGQLETQKRDLDEQLDRLESLDDRLPDLKRQRTQLEDQNEAKHAELDEKEDTMENADSTVDDTREQKAEFENALDAFQEARSNLDDIRYRLDSERKSIRA